MKKWNLSGLVTLSAYVAYRIHRRNSFMYKDKVVLITGGSRGLGLAIARKLALQGAKLALVARNERELERTKENIEELGAEVITISKDLTHTESTAQLVDEVVRHYGSLDVVINNAGIIQVGPLETMLAEDYGRSMALHTWAPLWIIQAALPHLKRTRGRIVNITSIGGQFAVPHMLPYTVSKFASVGLSEGLTSELQRYEIKVTTVCPGPMRTGSQVHAVFKGNAPKEKGWFSLSASLPIISIAADRAASKIINASKEGRAYLYYPALIRFPIVAHSLFPELFSQLLSLINRYLPKSQESREGKSGKDIDSSSVPGWLTILSRRSAHKFHQVSPSTKANT